MSNKFTGITSAGSAIPVYDKDAHEALSSKLDTTAFSSVSGEFATVDDVVAAVSGKADTSAIPSLEGYATQEWVGEQGYLTEVPESAVSGFATHEEVESATSGKADTSALSGYLTKASGDEFYVKNTPYEVTAGPTNGSGGDPIFRVNPGGLYVGNSGYKVLSATNNSFTVGDPTKMIFSASQPYGMQYSGLAGEFSVFGNFKVKVPGDVGISAGRYFSAVAPNSFSVSGSEYGSGYALSADKNELCYTTSGKNSDDEEIEKSRFTVKSGIAYSSYNGPVFSATNRGINFSGASANLDVTNSGINFSGASANLDVTSAIIFSSVSTAFGSAALTTAQGNQIVQMWSPKFEARNALGVGFSIEASGARGYDHNGNVVWDTGKSVANSIISFAGTQPAILISPTPASQSGYAPYLSAGYQELVINYNNGPSAIMNLNGFSIKNGNNQASVSYQGISVTGGDVNVYVPETSSSYTLRNSIQKSMIEGDSATSAITAIAGSAIGGGGGGASYSAGANIDITDNVISGRDWSEDIVSATSGLQPSGDYYSATNPSGFMTELPASATEAIDTVTANSGAWGGSALPISAGPGVKVDLVDNTLVFSNDETVLYSGDLYTSGGVTFTVSEPLDNFERIKIWANDGNSWSQIIFETDPNWAGADTVWRRTIPLTLSTIDVGDNKIYFRGIGIKSSATSNITSISAYGWSQPMGGAFVNHNCQITKVVGVNRKN